MTDKSIPDMGRGDLEEHAARLEERCSTLTEQVQTLQAKLHAKDREILEYERALSRAKTQIGHLTVEHPTVKMGRLDERVGRVEQLIDTLWSDYLDRQSEADDA